MFANYSTLPEGRTANPSNTTHTYMHLLANTNDEWIVEGTTDKERAKQLLAADFTYQLTSPDGYMLFRKPKNF